MFVDNNESQASLEAKKLISISFGKIAVSRVGRTGSNLHKSVLVASVLRKARAAYLDEVNNQPVNGQPIYQPAYVPMVWPVPPPTQESPPVSSDYPDEESRICPTPVPEEARLCPTPVPDRLCSTPVPEIPVPPLTPLDNKENDRLAYVEDEADVAERSDAERSRLPLAEANTVPTHTTNPSARKRRISDQETAAAVSSILPKRFKSDSREDDPDEDSSEANMEVEHITSLVSFFSFTQTQNQTDLCSAQAHHRVGQDAGQTPPILALTA